MALFVGIKVACRNLFGLLPKVKTPYIVAKRRNAKMTKPPKLAETAETAETSIIKFLYSFGIVYYKILIRFRHSFDTLLSLKKKNEKER